MRPLVSGMILVAALAASQARAEDPTTQFATELLSLTKDCTNHIGGGPWSTDKIPTIPDGKAYICGDKTGAVYWTADMDIDCDGLETAGKCDAAHDCCFQGQTAYMNSKGKSLTAAVDPYYVIPNNFPQKTYDIAGWQIAAIIYQGKLTYAFLADTGPPNIIGEASYATASILGINPDARNGGTAGPVTYIVFKGAGARPKIPENHDEVMQVGAKAAEAFLAANGVSTGIATAAKPDTRFSFQRKVYQVNLPGRHALQVADAKGNTVLWKTGEGPTEHDLSALNPGVYFIKAITADKKIAERRKIVLY
jgi:hypothetical protein